MQIYHLPKEKKSVIERLRVPFAVYQYIDKRVVTLALSDGFCRLFGYGDREQAYYDMDNDMYKDTHPDDAARAADAAIRFAEDGGKYEVIYRTKAKDRRGYRIIHASGEHVTAEDGTRLAHVWYSDEGMYTETSGSATELEIEKALSNALRENSMVKASHYDDLTGLPSMTYFFELAEAGGKQVRKKGGTPAMLYMDFIGMKFFNTRHGFSEGDNLLRSFAKLLASVFGNEQSCRIGADHFAVQTEAKGLEDKLKTLLDACRSVNDGKTLPLHVGVYTAQPEQVHVSVACDRAKLACHALNGRYGTAVYHYSSDLSEEANWRQYIVENIDRALQEHWIRVYIQPIIRAVNGRVCDVEALARWVDPEKGILSPAVFIPALEDAGLIYKLDLYMVDLVLESIRSRRKNSDFYAIPHSINLSRSDFDACDIVEEIRKRTDAVGVDRSLLTIEITESVIGSNFEFMKEQIRRFQDLGFRVWMDDFGSGYSSLDVLQSIRFDLIKFDMSFMRKLDTGAPGKVILTELMKMATSLDVDTVCEGVEKEEQVHFLQEIGCSKLQGFYYSKPVPIDEIHHISRNGTAIKDENPAESGYYESIGRVNLFDIGVMDDGKDDAIQHTFDTIPIAILEVQGDCARYVRSNRAYQDFLQRYFNTDILNDEVVLRVDDTEGQDKTSFLAIMRQCCETGNRLFFDEQLADGSISRSFAQRVSANPVTGSVAVAIAVLSITGPDEGTTYADIARALAADYYNIFVVDLDTDDYIEYSSRAGGEELSIERHGKHFFKEAVKDAQARVYAPDQQMFCRLFTRERVLEELDRQGVYTITYRLTDTGKPMYVNMKVTRMRGGNRIILGVSVVDAQMKQMEEERRLRRERASLGRIAALSPDYIVLYTINPDSGRYMQFSPSEGIKEFGLKVQGTDFFGDVRLDAPKVIAPEDLEQYLAALTKDNMMRAIQDRGSFVHAYRLVMDGKHVPARLKATMVEEEGRKTVILGVTNDENEEYRKQLEKAYKKASGNITIYTHVAHALARGYTDLYYVNIETDELIEFHTDDERGVLSEARRGTDFFEGCQRDVKLFVHKDDQAEFLRVMNREFLDSNMSSHNVYEFTYRRIKDNRTFYVQMKITRMEDDRRFFVLAVSDVDELIRKRQAEKADPGKPGAACV